MYRLCITAGLLACLNTASAGLDIFTGEARKPPEIKPFELPTLSGEKADYTGHINPLEPAPRLDADAIFQQAVNCYPEPSKFNLEINLEGGLRSQGIVTADNTTIGREYVGIVARMPLYSTSEMNREREREYMRRTKTSELIGAFLTAIATRNHARREISLYRALESRSQVRVQKGIVGTDEQVSYMEKLLGAHKTLIQSEADITSARLSITGQCDEQQRPHLNTWLKRMAVVPKVEKLQGGKHEKK
jgi:hypothetical protein